MPGYEAFDQSEKKEVMDVMETGILMRYGFENQRGGVNKTLEMEKALCEKLGTRHAQLTPSGTTAVSTALAVCGIGAGDEVIMPTFTFVASFESILALGAIPILVDIDDTLTLDPARVNRYDVREVTRHLNHWLDNQVRRKGLAYVLVPERHKDGAIHFHGFFNDALEARDSGTVSLPGQKAPRRPRSARQRALRKFRMSLYHTDPAM